MGRMVHALIPLVQTVTAELYGISPISNELYRAIAKQAKIDEHAKAYFDFLFPKLNEDPSELIDLLCRHPGLNPNISGSGNDLATFVVMPSKGFRLELDKLARYLTKSAMRHGCPKAVGHLENFLSLNEQGRVPGYEISVFRGLTISGEIEIAPGLDIIDYQRAVERGLVKHESPDPPDMMPDYAAMGALVLARQMTWGPCLVPTLTFKDEFPKPMPEFQRLPECGTGIVFDLLSVCTSHQVQILSMLCCAPEFVDVSPGFVARSGYSYIHSDEHWPKKDFSEEHVRHLQGLLRSWSQFNASKRDILELAVNRLSSSIQRNRGRFWVQDRLLDAAIALEIMYELGPPELTNKLSTRAAHLLAEKTDERIKIFDRVHVFYKARSQIAHGDKDKRKGKGNKKILDFKEAADSGFTLAFDTLQALLDKGDFPNWKKLIMSSCSKQSD